MKQYDDEQGELESRMEQLREELSKEKGQSLDIAHFVSLIHKFKNPAQVSDTIFRELVDRIVVYEGQGMGHSRTQKMDIYFNYVGQVNIAYSEEELAEMKRQEEQIAAEGLARQRAREKAARERRKAAKIAANGGEVLVKKVCPHCGGEFVPASNRQIFCSKACRQQAAQEQRKAKHQAECGNHSYRKRKHDV